MNKCTKCSKKFKTDTRKVGCGFCGKWFHIECEKVSEQLFDVLTENPQIHWYCAKCNDKAPEVMAVIQKCTKENADVRKEMADLKDEIKKIKEGRDEDFVEVVRRIVKKEIDEEREQVMPAAAVEIPGTTPEEIREIAKKEIIETNDKKVRESNIVLSGITEEADVNTEIQDLLTYLDASVEVNLIKRLGKDKKEGKKRLVLVKLGNKKERNDIFEKAKKLKDEERWKNVYINKDMTKEEMKQAYDLRVELRKRREDEAAAGGNAKFVISKGKVVKKASDREPETAEDGIQANTTA